MERKETKQESIVTLMKDNPWITAKEIAAIEDIGLTTVNSRIKKLRHQGRIYFEGKGGHGRWVVQERICTTDTEPP